MRPKFLDAGIQDVSTSISIFHDLIERYPEGNDGDESDKHTVEPESQNVTPIL